MNEERVNVTPKFKDKLAHRFIECQTAVYVNSTSTPQTGNPKSLHRLVKNVICCSSEPIGAVCLKSPVLASTLTGVLETIRLKGITKF